MDDVGANGGGNGLEIRIVGLDEAEQVQPRNFVGPELATRHALGFLEKRALEQGKPHLFGGLELLPVLSPRASISAWCFRSWSRAGLVERGGAEIKGEDVGLAADVGRRRLAGQHLDHGLVAFSAQPLQGNVEPGGLGGAGQDAHHAEGSRQSIGHPAQDACRIKADHDLLAPLHRLLQAQVGAR